MEGEVYIIMDVEKVLEIESKYHLYEDTIEGVQYWMYARHELCQLYFPYLKDPDMGISHNKLKNKASFIKKAFGLLWNSIWNGRRRASRAEVCIIDHERRVCEDGVYECKHTKEVYEYFKKKAIILERPYNYGHLKPINEEHIVYLDYISLLCNFYYLYVKYFRRKRYNDIYNQVKSHMEIPLAEMNQALQMNCSLGTISDMVSKVILRNQVRIKKMDELFDRIQPRILIETVGYSNTCMAANEVARKRNIIIYEMQHGAFGATHYGYNLKTDREIKQLPNYFLIFGDFWKLNFDNFLKRENIRAVGFPYLEKKIRIEKGKMKSDGKKMVLFLSSGEIGEKFARIACKFVEEVNESNQCDIVYKLHPGEYLVWEKNYPKLKELHQSGKIHVIDSSDSNLYALFSKADIQVVGTLSTTIHEGLAFGLKTIAYSIGDLVDLKYLFDKQYAYRIDDLEDVESIYRILMDQDEGMQVETGFFWKQNALKNIVEVIEETSGVKG